MMMWLWSESTRDGIGGRQTRLAFSGFRSVIASEMINWLALFVGMLNESRDVYGLDHDVNSNQKMSCCNKMTHLCIV